MLHNHGWLQATIMDGAENISIIPENSTGQSYPEILINYLIKSFPPPHPLGGILDLLRIMLMGPSASRR